jgi:hypothetical protein
MRGIIAAIPFVLCAFSSAVAETTLYCVPNEPRVVAPDRLVSVEVTLRTNGNFASVVYRAANGASYDRSQQYYAENTLRDGKIYWIGTLRIRRNIGMVGSLYRDNGHLFYDETVHDYLQGGKVVSEIVSVCDEPSSPNTSAASLRRQDDEERAAQAWADADRLDAERKDQEARTEKVAVLEKSRDLIRDQLLGCIGREGASMVLTDEKAEVVAKAAMIFCQSDVDAWVRSSMEITSTQEGQPSNPQAQHEAIEKTALDVITAYVVKARGELIRKSLDPKAPATATPSQDPKQGPPA